MHEELQELLRAPREDLDIELKQWMDPADKVVQAKFAKELIALRNHGGGYLVVGFLDGNPPTPDPARPAALEPFSTDYFNNILKKYAEPSFHCTAHLVAHPETGETYPVVVVPGGAKVPVRCKADGPEGGKGIKIDTYYIRRPGPESSPPQSAADWDSFLQRCMLNRKEELLAGLGSILGGGQFGVPKIVQVNPFGDLRKFRDEAVARLEALQAAHLAPGHPARFELGRYVLSARIVGDIDKLSPRALLDALSRLKRYTGWSPMYVFTKPGLAPYPMGDDVIECWVGSDGARDTAHADFWRISTEGLVTLIRGHQEDAQEIAGDDGSPPAGKGIELTLPPWRIAEFLLRVRELGDALANGPFGLQLIVQWEGLEGRKLFSHGGRRMMLEDFVAHEPRYETEVELTPDEVDAALPAIISRIVTPLLRRFSFFEPPRDLYEAELAKLMRREFA